MRKQLAAIAITAVSFGLSGCTPEEIAAVVAFHDSQTEAVTPAPTVTATVDCLTFDFSVSGYPTGTTVFIGMGSQPPFGFTVGEGYQWGFTPVDGGATGRLDVGLYEGSHSFVAVIEVSGERVVEQFVDCTPTATG